MSDLLEQAATWLSQQRTAFASRAVDYCRAAGVVTLSASLGVTNSEFEEVSGVLEQFVSRDFIVQASALVLSGQAITPQRGDRIQFSQDGTARVFEVTAPTGMECWAYSGPYGKDIRIHTKEIHA